MKVLVTMNDGSLVVLDRDIDVNEIAETGETAGDALLYRFIERDRISSSYKEWEYKTDWEIRDLEDSGKSITFVEEYDDFDDDRRYEELQAQREYEEDLRYEWEREDMY